MEKYYAVKLNDGNKHIVYADDDELEVMVKENIIKEYTNALDNWNTCKIYDNYICTELENKVGEICYHIQNVKGIENGDCPPDLNIKMNEAIEQMKDVINEIIAYQMDFSEELKKED